MILEGEFMLSPEEKLQRFSETVYKDAQGQCDAYLKEAEEKARAETEAYETGCLEAAYKAIKKQTAKIVRSASEKVSKAELKAKHEILLKRENIVNEVFADVTDKIAAYKQTTDYKNDLINSVKKAKEMCREHGIAAVYIAASDARLADDIKRMCNAEVIVSETDDLVGGICALIASTNKMLDMSYAAKLRDAKDDFFKSGVLTL